ncbi:hypothetical protein Tco_0002677 [Tanacetum coccineum]
MKHNKLLIPWGVKEASEDFTDILSYWVSLANKPIEAAVVTADAHPAPHLLRFPVVNLTDTGEAAETEWDLEEPVYLWSPTSHPDNYIEAADIDNLVSMEDDTIHGGFHEESPVGPDDAPTPTADAAGRAEDPTLLTSLSAKLDRCMGRIDSLETELGTSKKIMGGAILTLVSRVKKLERTVKQLKTARFVGDAPATEGDVDIQDDVDLEGLSRMASEALGHDQPAVPSEDMEEREEEEVPLRRKRSVYRRARTEFNTSAFAQFHAPLSADVLPQAAISESAGPSVAADKGKAPMPELDIPAEFLAEDAQARQRLEEEQASERLVQRLRAEDLAKEDLPNVSEERAKELDDLMMRMTETDWLNLMMQVGSNPALARELLGADVTEANFVERMTAIKEKKKRALADLRYRALNAPNGTITMKAVRLCLKPTLIEEYEISNRRLEKGSLQRVDRDTSQPSGVPAASTQHADDPDSAGGGSFKPAVSATPMAGFAVPDTAGGTLDSADSSSPLPVSTDHIPIDVLFESISGGINEFFLDSDEDKQRGQSISGHSVMVVDQLHDDEIVDPRVKVETVSDYASSPPRSHRKHIRVRGDDILWDRPVEDFFSSESESDERHGEFIFLPLAIRTEAKELYLFERSCKPHVYCEEIYLLLRRQIEQYFRLNPDVDIGLDLWRDVNLLCQSLHSDDVEDFWRTQDEWVVSSWKLYPKSSVHVLDLTDGKMLTFPPSTVPECCCLWLGSVYSDEFKLGLNWESMSVLHLFLFSFIDSIVLYIFGVSACTTRQMVFSSPWLTAEKESGSPLQTALVCNSNPLIALASPEQTATGKDVSNPLYGCDGLPKTVRVFQFTLDSRSEKLDWLLLHQDWKLLFFDVATSFDSAVHRVHAVSFDAAVFIYSCCLFCFCCCSILLLQEDLSRNLELMESKLMVPAGYVSAGHVLISADRYRIC